MTFDASTQRSWRCRRSVEYMNTFSRWVCKETTIWGNYHDPSNLDWLIGARLSSKPSELNQKIPMYRLCQIHKKFLSARTFHNSFPIACTRSHQSLKTPESFCYYDRHLVRERVNLSQILDIKIGGRVKTSMCRCRNQTTQCVLHWLKQDQCTVRLCEEVMHSTFLKKTILVTTSAHNAFKKRGGLRDAIYKDPVLSIRQEICQKSLNQAGRQMAGKWMSHCNLLIKRCVCVMLNVDGKMQCQPVHSFHPD